MSVVLPALSRLEEKDKQGEHVGQEKRLDEKDIPEDTNFELLAAKKAGPERAECDTHACVDGVPVVVESRIVTHRPLFCNLLVFQILRRRASQFAKMARLLVRMASSTVD